MWCKKDTNWGNVKGTKRGKERQVIPVGEGGRVNKWWYTICKHVTEKIITLYGKFIFSNFHMFKNWRITYFESQQWNWLKIYTFSMSSIVFPCGALGWKAILQEPVSHYDVEMGVFCGTDVLVIQPISKVCNTISLFRDLALPIAHDCHPLLPPQDWVWSKFCQQHCSPI